MKKLLVMMVGLATSVFAFGDPVTLPTGTSFEQLTADTALDLTKDDAGQAGGQLYWSSSDTELEAKVTAYDGDAYTGTRPAQFEGGDQNNYLTLQTGTKTPLLRTVEPNNDGIVPRDIGGGLYVDTLVKFTGCESAPEPGTEDKLIVWVKAPEEDAVEQTTNLVITAAYLDQFGSPIATNYIATVAGLTDFDGWHRVTVKAIADISSNGKKVPGFVIFVDEQLATCLDAKGDSGSVFDNLDSLAAQWHAKNALFPSMLVGAAAYQTLKAVGFEGSGAIDDVSFTAIAPAFAADEAEFTLAWDEHVEALSYKLNGGNEVTIDNIEAGSTTITISAVQLNTIEVVPTYEENYSGGDWDYNDCTLNDQTFTVLAGTYGASGKVISKKNLPPIGTATINGEQRTFTSLAEAFGMIPDATVASSIVLNTGLGELEIAAEDNLLESSNEDPVITLDLNGNTIKGDSGEVDNNYALDVFCKLVIVDTVGGGKIIAGEGQSGAIFNDWELTITAGELQGRIDVYTDPQQPEDDAITTLTGGKYLKANGNTKEELAGWLDPEADPELMVDDSDEFYFEVKEKQVTTYTATFTAGTGVTGFTYTLNGGSKQTYTDKITGLKNGDVIVLKVAVDTDAGYQAVPDKTYTVAGENIEETINATLKKVDIKVMVGTHAYAMVTNTTAGGAAICVNQTGTNTYTAAASWGDLIKCVFTADAGYKASPTDVSKSAVLAYDEEVLKIQTTSVKPIKYKYSFAKAGDEVGDPIADIAYTVETQETLEAPACTWTLGGFEFAGWTNKVDGGAIIAAGATLEKVLANTVLTAAWTEKQGAPDPADDDPTKIDPTETAATRYGDRVPAMLANVSAKELCTWAQGNGGLQKGEEIEVKAFLFNIANASDEAAVKAEEAYFAFTSFSADAVPVAGENIPNKNSKGDGYYGDVVITAHADPACKTDYVSGDQKFYKATLQPRNVVK